MQTLWAYGKHYEIDDNINLYDFIDEKWREEEKNRAFEELRKENERLRSELNDTREGIPPNIGVDIGTKTLDTIMEEGKNIASQLAMDGLTKAFRQKGIKIKWNKR